MKRIFSILALSLSAFAMFADTPPSFPGGESALNDYLEKNVKYPQNSYENGVEGVVAVGFVVAIDGSLKNAKVIKFVDPDLEKEALRVVNGMPKWIPAEKNGAQVEAPAEVDVPFIID